MADWNKPTVDDYYEDFLNYIKALAVDAATQFLNDPTNTPTGAVRFNRTTNKFEEWNGSTWETKVIALGGGGLGNVTAPANGQIPIGNGSSYSPANISGTSNRVTVTNGGGSITLSGPQDLHTAATPTFGGLTLNGALAMASGFNSGDYVRRAVSTNNLETRTAAQHRSDISAAVSGANADITALSGLTTSTWTPTIAANSPLTVSNTLIRFASYIPLGKFCFFSFDIEFDSGTAGPQVTMTIPLWPNNTFTKPQSGLVTGFIPGVGYEPIIWECDGPFQTFTFKRPGNAVNFPASTASIELRGTGVYITV